MINRYIFNIVLWVGAIYFPILSYAQQGQDTSAQNNSIAPFQKQEPVYMDDYIKAAEDYFSKNTGGYKAYKRMEQYMLNRLGADGQIVNSTSRNYKAYQALKEEHHNNLRVVAAHNGHWQFLGPWGIYTGYIEALGRVNRFAFHPTDENIVYASTAGGGVWKSDDKGITWLPLSDGIPVMNTSGVAVDFNDPDILYVLSGDGDNIGGYNGINQFTRTSIGVFKTTDGGTIWSPTGLVFDETTTAVQAFNLSMSPEDSETLYACTHVGLFRTRNGAETWDTIRTGLIYEMEFKPGNAEHIYCVDKDYIYISHDGGDTWIDSTFIPPVDEATGRMIITTCLSNPEVVYLLASPLDTLDDDDQLPDHRGLWRSDNSGEDFTLITTRPNLMAGHSGTEFKTQASYDFAFACNPEDENALLVGSIGVWNSPDGGLTWENDNGINNYYHADIHDIQVNPLDNNVYMGTDGGVSWSDNFGYTWTPRVSGLACAQFYKVATSPFFSTHILMGAQDNGVQLRHNESNIFRRSVWGDGMESLFHPSVDSLVISSTQNGEIYISTDTGRTFVQILPEIPSGDSTEWTTPLAFDANNPAIIYAGYKPIMKSIDQGETFFATSNDTISAHKFLVNNLSNPNRLYAGDCVNCNNGSLRFEMYMSPDAGVTWQKIDTMPGFPGIGKYVSAAIVNPDDSQEIWITCGRYDANAKVFRSIDAGDTWTNETGTLPNVPVNGIVFEDNDGSPSGAVYIATDIGVFYRNDDLGDWIYFSNSLPIVEVTDLDIDYIGGYLVASTYGRGLWRSELYTACNGQLSLNPANQVIGRSYVHQAANFIQSTAHVDGYGSRVVYKAGAQVKLMEGFRATSKNGAFFKGLLGPCNVGGITPSLQDNDGESGIKQLPTIQNILKLEKAL